MKKSGRLQSKKKPDSKDTSLSLSILAYAPESRDKIHLFLESIQKIKKPFLKDYEILFLTKEPGAVEKEINRFEDFAGLIKKRLSVLSP